MKLNEPVNGSPVVTPLKISSVLGQKLSKVDSTQKNVLLENGAAHDDDSENFPDDDEDSTKDEDLALTFIKDKTDMKSVDMEVGEGNGSVVADGSVAGIDNDTAETEEESTAGGKKKGVRKKRSINWEEAERSLLVEVIKPKAEFVENKAVDAKSIKSKRMAWLHVTKQFNSLNFRHRSLEQIQVQWRSMKNSAKKEYQQKHPKTTTQLEGLQMLEFMEEMQKEPVMGGTRSQTRNSTIQNSIKKELLDDMEDEEEDTPLAALPNALMNHSNSEDTQPTSTLAMQSPPTSADLQHMDYQPQQLLEGNNMRMKKKKSTPKIKQRSPLLSSKLQESSSSGCGIGLKIKRQKCETSTSSSSLTDVSTTGVMLPSMSNANTNANYHNTDSKTANNTITLTSINSNNPPLSPPTCLDGKYKKQLFDLIKRARLAEIDYARKEHEQKLRFEQQEQELKLRFMTEIHEQRMRFCLQEHEARMHVYDTATATATPTPTNTPTNTPNASLLVEVIKPKAEFVENKAVDAKSIKSKRMAWLHVTKQFNSLNFRHRSLEQIQVQWRSMKNSAKKEYQQKHPKTTTQLEGLQMLEFMEEMQKEPVMGGTRSQTRNSTIQNSIKKELLDDMEDEEEDTPLAALPNALMNHSNSEDTQPTSTLAMQSPPTSADLQHMDYQPQQLLEGNNMRMKKKKSTPKIKQRSPLLSSKLQESSSSGCGIGLKIKRQKCETSTSSSSLTDVSTTGVMLPSMSNANTNANYHNTDSKTANNTITLTSINSNNPPLSPPTCLDGKYKKQLFDLIKRARLAEIDYARKEHEQKLRFEQQEQELKLRFMTEIHEQRMRFCLQEHEARMHVYDTATATATPTPTNTPTNTPNAVTTKTNEI